MGPKVELINEISAYFVNNFVHVRLPTLEPIRAALTSQNLLFDTKFSPSQSHVTLL